jgi:hypothetical protein
MKCKIKIYLKIKANILKVGINYNFRKLNLRNGINEKKRLARLLMGASTISFSLAPSPTTLTKKRLLLLVVLFGFFLARYFPRLLVAEETRGKK